MAFFQENMLYINIIILMVGLTSVHLGVSFLRRERHTKGFFKYAVFLLALGSGLCSLGYGLMSLTPNLQLAYIFRLLGLLGIDIYIIAEIILITSCLNMSRVAEYFIILVTTLAAILDLIIYGNPGANTFYRLENYTIYVRNDPYRHLFHYSYQIVIAFCLLLIGLVWAFHVKYRRDKELVFFAFVSNIIFALSSVPDFFLTMHEIPFLHAFYCIGVSVAFAVFYVSANDYMVFYITINSISKDIFSTLGTGLLVFDTNYHLNLTNEYAKKLLGLDKEPQRIRLREIFDLQPGEPLKMFEKSRDGIAIDYRLTANVTGKVTLVNFSCKMDRNNQPMCYILVATDLTEENRLIQEAQSANAAKSNFLSNISHEIRTPINVISGMNELILRECKDKSILKYAENINVASRNLTSLINDVLDFSKIESGKIDLVSNDFDIGGVLNDSYNLFLSLAQKKRQTFSLECNSTTPSILTFCFDRLKQILSNLISNAVKYTPEGGSINVSVNYKEMNEERILLVLNVKDTGMGIQPEDLPNLFQNFQRFELSKNRTIQGSGLGLAITKNLVTLMHGTISVESIYGKGSSFTVRIPFNVVDHAPVGEVKEHFKAGSTEKYKVSFSAEKARVLAVDDVQMNLDVFVGLLKKTNIKIDCALSGKDALALTKVNRYDMIFLDHMMPEMDGIEVLKRLKADVSKPNQETPVIMITANALMGADRKYLDDGFDDYLSKPINPSALENMVLKHLPDKLISKEILVEEPAAAVPTPEAVGVVTNTPNVPEEPKKDLISSLDFLDTAAGLQFAAGDMDFYKQILLTYLNEDKRASLNELREKKDWKNYQIVAHSLKGTSLTIGAPLLSEAAKGLEFAVKENRPEYIEEHHDEVIEMYGVLLDQLSEVLIEE